MSQCQRCGAVNDPISRFCVACGSPLVGRSNPAASPAPQPAPAPPVANPYAAPPAPAVIRPYEGAPPNSSLQYAETAAPPTGDEFEAQRAARAAALAAAGVLPPQSRSSAPPPYRPSAIPSAAFASTTASATAAMPGVTALDPEAVPEGSPRILAGFLISYDVQPLGRAWPIFQGTNRIGRQGAGVPLDLELDHPTASSRHAVILASACPGRMKLEDTGSTNGTMLNGARLAPGARHEIKDGDRIRFGLLSTIVKIA
ncbi:MAG TPA: FHA domain-containing protein [Polyangiaceae bacterium]